MNRLLAMLLAALFVLTAMDSVAEDAARESQAQLDAAFGRGAGEVVVTRGPRVERSVAAAMREPGKLTRGSAGDWRDGRFHEPGG